MALKPAIPGQENKCRLCQFSLLACIDGMRGAHEAVAASESDLDEDEAVPVQHDQIDLAAAAAKITCYRNKALLAQVVEYPLLGVPAYRSCVVSYHVSSSESSGGNSSLASLIS